MFGKKECKRCGEKSSKKHNFCPNCGVPFNEKNSSREDYGMLGESDFSEDVFDFNSSFLGGLGGKMMGKMFESAVRMLEKEMQREMKRGVQNSRVNFQPRTNFQMFINGKKVNFDNGFKIKQHRVRKKKEIPTEKLPSASFRNFSDLPKKEPETNVRRFSDKVIYEISVPGVKSEKEMSIIKLENSIEIRAMGNNLIYRKIIPVNMPITDFKVEDEKLVLELGLRE